MKRYMLEHKRIVLGNGEGGVDVTRCWRGGIESPVGRLRRRRLSHRYRYRYRYRILV